MLGRLAVGFAAAMATMSIYCDGSAHPRPGLAGGWAYVIVLGDEAVCMGSGGDRCTTNNVMEMTAALRGLQEAVSKGWHREHALELVSDSRVTLEVASGGPLPARHVELWRELRAVFAESGAVTRWVRGHSGDRWNETVDAKAFEEMRVLVPAKARRRQEARKP